MKILAAFISAIFISIGLTACGYDGHYRYPCQDPANFGTEECVPPLCEVTGQCTTDLIGFDPTTKEEMSQDSTDETTSDIIDEPSAEPAPENVDNINNMVDEVSEGN